jgi:hypothetical protein
MISLLVERWIGRGSGKRPAVSSQNRQAASCADCRYFLNDPHVLEREIAGLSSLSSARASVRADDGICVRHDRMTGRRFWCREHFVFVDAVGREVWPSRL